MKNLELNNYGVVEMTENEEQITFGGDPIGDITGHSIWVLGDILSQHNILQGLGWE